MFKWYEQADVCIGFLSDLRSGPTTLEDCNCKWFTRGWTLQELLAPRKLIFYDETWVVRGTKASLASEISKISGIKEEVLIGERVLSDVPVAVRMSWAAGRSTKRLEDRAYCLLGIFDVNMAMLYGEGDKAFIRLQEEIIRKNPDMSIFAWKTLLNSADRYTGLLAPSP